MNYERFYRIVFNSICYGIWPIFGFGLFGVVMIKKFEKFLKRNDILDRFQKNYDLNKKSLSKYYRNGPMPDNVLEFANTTDPRLYMSHCFLWQKTPESRQFWSDYNQKWWREIGVIS